MKIKTSELTDAALDWAVLTALGIDTIYLMLDADFKSRKSGVHIDDYYYSTDGALASPIIEREGIATRRTREGKWYAMMSTDLGDGERAPWAKGHWKSRTHWVQVRFSGNTQLEAAMRCFVASKLGDTVDVPDELVNS